MRRINFLLFAAAAVLLLSACSHFSGFYSGDHDYYSDAAQEQTPPSYEQRTYLKADRPLPARHALRKKCVNFNGHKVCGYDCKVSLGRVRCAKKPDQRCVVSPSGQVICGYGCVRSYHGAACGKHQYDNCVTNAAGDVRCGNNCYEREEDGALICGK